MSAEKTASSGDGFTHVPLPYLVTARVIQNDDAPPERVTVRQTAYSLFEAMFQTSIQLGGTGFQDAKVHIEKIEPDIAGYAALMAQLAAGMAKA